MSRSRDFPDNGELVVCSVVKVEKFGANVTLDEYDDKPGFIHVGDVTTGWVKYIRDYVKEGQKIVCKVLGVDSSKGHIDLSLKAVNNHQKAVKIQHWKNEKKAEKLVEIVAERLSITVDEAYKKFVDKILEDYDSLYEAFESVAIAPEEFKSEYKGKWVPTFIEVAVENVAPPSVQIDGILELKSYAPNGVEVIRNGLDAGLEFAEDAKVEITAIGSPRYRILITADEYKEAEELMKKISNVVVKSVVAAGGEASFKRETK